MQKNHHWKETLNSNVNTVKLSFVLVKECRAVCEDVRMGNREQVEIYFSKRLTSAFLRVVQVRGALLMTYYITFFPHPPLLIFLLTSIAYSTP